MNTRRSRLSLISTGTLRGWLRALEAVPSYMPLVVDLRISVRNELWRREREEDGLDAWVLEEKEGAE